MVESYIEITYEEGRRSLKSSGGDGFGMDHYEFEIYGGISV